MHANTGDLLTEQGVARLLAGRATLCNVRVYETVDSTNDVAKKLLIDDADHGTVIIARHQTGGRGRFDRKFFSPKDQGIYMSVILRSGCSSTEGALLTSAVAVSCCQAIGSLFNVDPCIKWANDILISGRKICGILTEFVVPPGGNGIIGAVIGLGVNFCGEVMDLPEEIRYSAGAIVPLCGDAGITQNQLAAEILNRLFEILDGHEIDFMREYREKSCVIGRDVVAVCAREELVGRAVAIGDDGSLQVRLPDGELRYLMAGEVSIRGNF